VLATTAALGRWEEFRLHLGAGLDRDLEWSDVEEVLLQAGVYAGVPLRTRASRSPPRNARGAPDRPLHQVQPSMPRLRLLALVLAGIGILHAQAHVAAPRFKVLAFYTGKEDLAHISFDGEANTWFADLARAKGFSYEATTDWQKLNAQLCRSTRSCSFSTRDPTIRPGAKRSGNTCCTAAPGWDFTSPASR
jgi:hypothetical protein